MLRYLVIIAFILSAVTACDSSDKAVKQEKAAEVPAEQLNENTRNDEGKMTDAIKDTAEDMLEGAENMAENVGEASSDAYDELKDSTKQMMDDTEEAVDNMKQETEK